jgi:hypothetical protein
MDGPDLFAKVDQQISALKERIARQHEVIKQAKLGGHSTAAAETNSARLAPKPSRVRETPPASL